jgi:hypothetical protein
MKRFIDELAEIKKKVEIRERIFYSNLGVSDFNELNNKIN